MVNIEYTDKYRIQYNEYPRSCNSDLSDLSILLSLFPLLYFESLQPFTYALRGNVYHDLVFKNRLENYIILLYIMDP